MRGDKKDYVQLGVRIPPQSRSELATFYQGYGMLSKVVRVLIDRHLKKLKEREAAAAQGLTAGLDGEIVTVRELENVN